MGRSWTRIKKKNLKYNKTYNTMKKLLIILLTSTFCFGQSEKLSPQKVVIKFYIQEAIQNNIDVTDVYIKEKAFITLFEQDNKLFLSNVMQVDGTQSYGITEPISKTKLVETTTSYKADIYNFNWKYRNTYNNKVGIANVQFAKVYQEDSFLYILEVHCENGDNLIYKGTSNE